jgi:hypothetical protein
MQVTNPGENPQRRALLQALEEAKEQFDALPFNSRERPKLALLMVRLEDRILVLGDGL